MTDNHDILRPPVRILVLDDEIAIVDLLCEMLKIMGYEAVAASRPGEALELLSREKFDLVLSDFRMPEMNGQAFHTQVQSRDPALARRIIFLTGEASVNVFPSVESTPRVAHLKKPIDLEHLNSMVRSFIDKFPVA